MIDICGDCGKVRYLVDGVVCGTCDIIREGGVLSDEEIYYYDSLSAAPSLSDPWGKVGA